MERSRHEVVLSLSDGAVAGSVAGEVALGMALRAGFPPLAAERVRAAIADALADVAPGGTMAVDADPGEVRVRLLSADAAWRDRTLAALDAHGAEPTDGGVAVTFRAIHRGALRAVT